MLALTSELEFQILFNNTILHGARWQTVFPILHPIHILIDIHIFLGPLGYVLLLFHLRKVF